MPIGCICLYSLSFSPPRAGTFLIQETSIREANHWYKARGLALPAGQDPQDVTKMATVGTEDSNLLFQFNSPVNSPSMFLQDTASKKQAEDSASTLVAPAFEDQHTLFSVPTLVRPVIPTPRSVLGEAKAFSHYNNYLNDKLAASTILNAPLQPYQKQPQQQQQQQRSNAAQDDLQMRKRKMEELVDKFWLKDGEIDESIFDDSSDEEGL